MAGRILCPSRSAHDVAIKAEYGAPIATRPGGDTVTAGPTPAAEIAPTTTARLRRGMRHKASWLQLLRFGLEEQVVGERPGAGRVAGLLQADRPRGDRGAHDQGERQVRQRSQAGETRSRRGDRVARSPRPIDGAHPRT
jgi:hypothetical protein